jgi:hypothetical protein
MVEVVMCDDDDVITHDPLRMRGDVITFLTYLGSNFYHSNLVATVTIVGFVIMLVALMTPSSVMTS